MGKKTIYGDSKKNGYWIRCIFRRCIRNLSQSKKKQLKLDLDFDVQVPTQGQTSAVKYVGQSR
jgi:hypothetical protein